MKKLILCYTLLLLSFSALAQLSIEEFEPLPKNIKRIEGVLYAINEGDTISEIFSQYNFDKKGNIISWEHFHFGAIEKRKYDSLGRVTKIDGVYGQSPFNGVINYEYPSKNQKIEIHDTRESYKYIQSELTFNSNGKLIKEIQQDSTFYKIDEYDTIYQTSTTYLYDKYENLIKKLSFANSSKKINYEMHAIYDEKRLLKRTKSDGLVEISYIKNGEFKNQIDKKIQIYIKNSDTVKYDIIYSYLRLSPTIFVQERVSFNEKEIYDYDKFYYENNRLIKLEKYRISTESKELELDFWINYQYIFY